ncbi:MAG: molecular chaperone TorD family protein [Bacillota bacterium]|nr:molecular chaperone TorD family protein [Bacillota bacterium]
MKTKEKLDLLSLLFSRPDEFIKERIKDGSLGEMLETAFPQLSFSEFKDPAYRKNLEEKISKDYLYLFVGVSKPLASPYESSYYKKDSRLMDKPARDMIKLMKKWGLEFDQAYKDLPDHIGAKLAVIATLLDHKDQVQEEVLKAEIDKDIKEITKNMTWLESFKEKISANEEVVFYSKLSQAIIDSLKEI